MDRQRFGNSSQKTSFVRTSIEIRKRESLTSSPKSPRKKSRDARTAVVNVHATSVTINPGSGFEPVTLNAVLVEEPNPDNVDVPIQCYY